MKTMLLTIIMTLLSARVILGQTTDNHNKEVEEEANNDAINKDKVFPEDEPINSVASYSKNSLEKTTKGIKTSKVSKLQNKLMSQLQNQLLLKNF